MSLQYKYPTQRVDKDKTKTKTKMFICHTNHTVFKITCNFT